MAWKYSFTYFYSKPFSWYSDLSVCLFINFFSLYVCLFIRQTILRGCISLYRPIFSLSGSFYMCLSMPPWPFVSATAYIWAYSFCRLGTISWHLFSLLYTIFLPPEMYVMSLPLSASLICIHMQSPGYEWVQFQSLFVSQSCTYVVTVQVRVISNVS